MRLFLSNTRLRLAHAPTAIIRIIYAYKIILNNLAEFTAPWNAPSGLLEQSRRLYLERTIGAPGTEPMALSGTRVSAPGLWRILLGSIKARAGLEGIEEVMRGDERIGVAMPEVGEQRTESGLLSRGTGVLRTALRREATYIADTDRVLVAVLTMRPHHLLRTAPLDGAIEEHQVMIPDRFPTPGPVPTADIIDGEGLSLGSSRTVHNDKSYRSHDSGGLTRCR